MFNTGRKFSKLKFVNFGSLQKFVGLQYVALSAVYYECTSIEREERDFASPNQNCGGCVDIKCQCSSSCWQ